MSLWLEPAVFPVVLDSCVLYPRELRDVLLEAANHRLYRVHWSSKILDDALGHLLVTRNTRHFPAEALVPLGMKAVKPDQFLCNLLDLSEPAIYGGLRNIVSRRAKHTTSGSGVIVNTLLESLKRDAKNFASRISEFLVTEAWP